MPQKSHWHWRIFLLIRLSQRINQIVHSGTDFHYYKKVVFLGIVRLTNWINWSSLDRHRMREIIIRVSSTYIWSTLRCSDWNRPRLQTTTSSNSCLIRFCIILCRTMKFRRNYADLSLPFRHCLIFPIFFVANNNHFTIFDSPVLLLRTALLLFIYFRLFPLRIHSWTSFTIIIIPLHFLIFSNLDNSLTIECCLRITV